MVSWVVEQLKVANFKEADAQFFLHFALSYLLESTACGDQAPLPLAALAGDCDCVHRNSRLLLTTKKRIKMPVPHLSSTAEIRAALEKAGGALVLVDFSGQFARSVRVLWRRRSRRAFI